MEVMQGWTHTAFPLDDASRIGAARRHGARLSAALNWDDVDAGRLALVITELATNLFRHATSGQMLIALRPASQDIEVVCFDQGPGIANVARVMADGVSTGGGSPGTGLGAVQRAAASFEMHSTVPQGTVSVARVGRRAGSSLPQGAAYAFGAICVPVKGESVCGDAWGIALDGARATVMVADGLGHGPLAAQASGAAIDGFLAQSGVDLRAIVEEAHVRLQSTRGAAICVLRIDAEATTVQCAGAGNVVVRIVTGVSDRSMITQHGTVGAQIRKPDHSSVPLPPHALTIVHSDGLSTRWDPACITPVLERDPTLAAALLFRNFARGRDDATVVVVRQEAMA